MDVDSTPVAGVPTNTVTPSPDVASPPEVNNAIATDEQKKKKKKGIDKSKKVELKGQFLTYLRPSTFDSDAFKKGHAQRYSEGERKKNEDAFQRSLVFNFDASYAKKKQQKRDDSQLGRSSRSSTAQDLDHINLSAYNVQTTNRRELSRYIVEDVVVRNS